MLTYRRDLRAFASYLGVDAPSDAIKVILGCTEPQANGVALKWLKAMRKEGLATNTQARRISTLRCLTRSAKSVGLLSWVLDVRAKRGLPYRDTRGPLLKTVRKLLADCGDDLEGHRNRLILLLLFGFGLRRFEVVGLQRKHYDREGHRLYIKRKGDKEAWKTLPLELEKALQKWLEIRPAWVEEDDDSIMCTLRNPGIGKPLTNQGLNHVVTKMGERIGVKVWPHGLRHAAITQGFTKKHTMEEMQQFSGHSDPQTLMTYNDNLRDDAGNVAQTLVGMLLGTDDVEEEEDVISTEP